MYTANGNTIILPRGDSAEIAVTLIDSATEQPYILSSAESVRFDLYSVRNADPLVSRSAANTAQEQDGTIPIVLRPIDTAQLCGTYKYIIRIVNASTGDTDTVIGLENDAYMIIK